VYRLVTEHSVEERILARAEKKLYLDAVVARGAGAGGAGGSEDAEAAADDGADGARASDVRYGADAVFRPEAGAAPSEEELDALCDRTPGGEARRAALDALRCGRAGGDATAGSVAAALSAPPPPLAAALPPEEVAAARAAAAAAAARRAAAAAAHLPRAARRRGPAPPPPPPAAPPKPARGSRQVAGRDYAWSTWCQVCFDGGELFCCDVCPAAYHAECIDTTPAILAAKARWSCPHHTCAVCGRSPAAAGGLLFRCESCAGAFCDEHLPEDVLACGRLVEGGCDRFRRLGAAPPPNALFVHCSEECAGWAAQGFGLSADELSSLAPPAPPAWVHAGDEALALPPLARRGGAVPAPVPLRAASFAQLKAFLLLLLNPSAPLLPGAGAPALRNMLPADGDVAFGALYAAARDAVLRGAQPPPERSAAEAAREAARWDGGNSDSDDGDSSGSSDDDDDDDASDDDGSGGRRAGGPRRARVAWSDEETATLLAAVAVCGTRWNAVHAHARASAQPVLPCRTVHDLCMRYQRIKAKAAAAANGGGGGGGSGSDGGDGGAAGGDGVPPAPRIAGAPVTRAPRTFWSAEESAALQALVAEHGVGSWRAAHAAGIARGVLLPRRSPGDLRQRWLLLQKAPGPTQRTAWPSADAALLLRLVERHGADEWERVRADADAAGTTLPQRSAAQLKEKWRTMRRQAADEAAAAAGGAAAAGAGDEEMRYGDGDGDDGDVAMGDGEEAAQEEEAMVAALQQDAPAVAPGTDAVGGDDDEEELPTLASLMRRRSDAGEAAAA
jgi:hypothetical protein